MYSVDSTETPIDEDRVSVVEVAKHAGNDN